MYSAVLLLLILSLSVHADVMCVENAAELQLALSIAAVNGQADEIRLAAGTYTAPAGGFVYDATGSGSDAFGLSILGGWNKQFGFCFPGTPDAAATELVGSGSERVMTVLLKGLGELTVEGLTFTGGTTASDGGGLRIIPANGYAGTLTVRRNRFIGNQADSAAGLSIRFEGSGAGSGAGARYHVVQNLFAMNQAVYGCSALRVLTSLPEPVPISRLPALVTRPAGEPPVNAQVLIAGNTATGNSDDAGEAGGVCMLSNVLTRVIANNQLWGNQGADLVTVGAGYVLLNNNLGIHLAVDPPVMATGNLNTESNYGPCVATHCWIPAPGSLLIDAGTQTLPPGMGDWLGEQDVRGAKRIAGAGLDIGAYESDWTVFADRFEQH